MAFADVVAVPGGNLDYDIAFDHSLATKTGTELIIGRLFHAIEFIVIHLGKRVLAFFHHDMAGGAGTTASAGMFEVETEIHRNIQKRTGAAMSFVGQGRGIELKRLAGWQEGNAWQVPIIRGGKIIRGTGKD